MHPAIEAKREPLAALCRRHGVRRLEVFGSAARGSDFDPARSDADFLVTFDDVSPGTDDVSLDTVWVTVRDRVPPLIANLEALVPGPDAS